MSTLPDVPVYSETRRSMSVAPEYYGVSVRNVFDTSTIFFLFAVTVYILCQLDVVSVPAAYVPIVHTVGFLGLVGMIWGLCKSSKLAPTRGGEGDMIYSSIIGGLSNPFYQV